MLSITDTFYQKWNSNIFLDAFPQRYSQKVLCVWAVNMSENTLTSVKLRHGCSPVNWLYSTFAEHLFRSAPLGGCFTFCSFLNITRNQSFKYIQIFNVRTLLLKDNEILLYLSQTKAVYKQIRLKERFPQCIKRTIWTKEGNFYILRLYRKCIIIFICGYLLKHGTSKNNPKPETIRNFKIGEICNFLLTFSFFKL